MSNSVRFALEKRPLASTGIEVDTLVKYAPGQDPEEWCNVLELDELFEVCTRRWPRGWDLGKLMTAVRECDFD